MQSAIAHLQSRVNVDATRMGLLAWSYTGEMATQLQMAEPRVTLVVGLSTALLNDWVFNSPDAVATLDPRRLTAAYAVLTQSGNPPAAAPTALDRIASAYFIEFPRLAHGSFNALEGYIPSRFGIGTVQSWSLSGDAGVSGYESVAIIVARLLRHHVEAGASDTVARLPLTTAISAAVANVRLPSVGAAPR